jgi:CheY-like chemotaxis protein
VGLLQDITPRRQAEEGLRQLTAELEQRVAKRTEELLQSENRLRALSRELNLAEQRERRRLATDLHDYLAQLLVLGRIKLAQAKAGELPQNSMTLINETEAVLTQALSYTRSLVGQLCPPVLKEFGLVVALKWLAEQMQQHHLTVTVHAEGDRLPLADDQAVLLFQSARELLMNTVKHASTDRATVTVSRLDGVLRVVVEDKGCGFDETVAPVTSQFGLFSIKERMQALGGRFIMLSEAGKGTTATLALPLTMPPPESVLSRAFNGDHGTPLQQWSIEDAVSGQSSRKQPAEPLVSELSVSARVRVLLVDDHAMIRQGLKTILEGYPEIDIVGEAANGIEALTLTRTRQPDIVIMDVTMPRMDGIEATRLIKEEWPSVLVIGLSVHSAPQVGDTMREAGAFSVLTKEAAVDDLHRTIQQALNSHPGGGGRTGRQETGDAGAALR